MGEGSSDANNGLLELDDPAVDPEAVESGVAATPTPTLVPPFDPERYAEETEFRERMPTLTDDSLLEEARLQSIPSNVPPPRPLLATSRPGPSAATSRPGPLLATSRDSSVEIDTGESDLESLEVDDQVAILSVRLAPLTRVPVLARELTELGALLQDPKTAYVLGFVDGLLPLETIIDVTGLPELETLRVLDRMIAQSVVIFKS